MASVTKRISEVKQPRGGYLKPSLFEEIKISDDLELSGENISPIIIGLAVDYLTRFMLLKADENNTDMIQIKVDSFNISLKGYLTREHLLGEEAVKQDEDNQVEIDQLLDTINGLDDESIIAACKAVTYDVWYRNPMQALNSKNAMETNPDKDTVNNIRIMVTRSLNFWKLYGPVLVNGFTYNDAAYTDIITKADGDYLTNDTLWDFKVSKSKPTNKHTLQLLIYWIMGKHSKQVEFSNVNKLGIFNPRLNTVYLYDMDRLDKDVIKEVEEKVIGY